MSGRLLVAALLSAWGPLAAAAGFVAVAPGDLMLAGSDLAAAAPPHGEAGNVGLLVGKAAALVFDTGASHRQGRAVLAAVRAVSAAPVRWAVISHALPEFLFGATALQEASIPVVAERDTAALIAQRCAMCLDRFKQAYGEAAMEGSRVPRPDRLIDHSEQLDLGGRTVELIDFGLASTPGDVAAFDRAGGVLFAGGLVVIDRVPLIRDGDVKAWIAALDRIAALPVRRIVPGHGPVVGREGIAPLRDYLADLDAAVRRLYEARVGLAETLERAALPRYARWAGYPAVHRQNVQHLYLALERAELQAAPR